MRLVSRDITDYTKYLASLSAELLEDIIAIDLTLEEEAKLVVVDGEGEIANRDFRLVSAGRKLLLPIKTQNVFGNMVL